MRYELLSEKDEFGGGSGNIGTDNFKEQEDGSIIGQIRDGDEHIPVTFSKNADGTFDPVLPDDYDDEDKERLAPKVDKLGETIGSYYKRQMLQNKKDAETKARLDRLEAENRELRQAISGTKEMELTDAEAQQYFGVDADDLTDLSPSRYAAGMKKYLEANRDIDAIVERKVNEKLTAVNAQNIKPDDGFFKFNPLRKPAKSVEALGGVEKKPQKKSDARKANELMAGISS